MAATNRYDLSNDLQFPQKTIMEHMAKILEWEEVQPIFEYYLSCWPNDIPLNWARLAWSAAAKDGLPVYCSEKEEMKARSVATILSLFYYEYCHRSAWHENKNFKIWSDDVRINLKNDLLDHWKEVDESVQGVAQALLKNVDEASLPAELWINCVEASRGFVMSAKERSEMFTKLVNDQWQDFNYNQGECFVRAGFISEPGECESISGLGLF